MDNDNTDNEDEKDLFRQIVKNVRPLKQDKISLRKPPPSVPKKVQPAYQEESSPIQLSDHQTEETVLAIDRLFFARPGLSPKQIRRFRQGKIVPSGVLDLHGEDSETAKQKLIQFLLRSHKEKKRCVVIVHGKGHSEVPILKNKINNWLRQIDLVLGFCSAAPSHGGAGAVYVLLRR
jgi:DNA-nicking Smr family endonuclease